MGCRRGGQKVRCRIIEGPGRPASSAPAQYRTPRRIGAGNGSLSCRPKKHGGHIFSAPTRLVVVAQSRCSMRDNRTHSTQQQRIWDMHPLALPRNSQALIDIPPRRMPCPIRDPRGGFQHLHSQDELGSPAIRTMRTQPGIGTADLP